MIPSERSQIKVAAATHPGMKGKNNEDRYDIRHFQISENNFTSSTFAVVSDGIGGHHAGEVAAQIAVDTICHYIEQSDASTPAETVKSAVAMASRNIRQAAGLDSHKRGMGATCACVWVIGNRLYTASVGDTRIYWIRGDIINKLSIDHTWVQEAIDLGAIDQDQAKDHPNAHVIRRYLGSPNDVVPDLRMRLKPHESDEQSEANQGLRLVSGDVLFLCSDGLTDLVNDAEILSAIRTQELGRAVDGLVKLANERGGHDNITIIALEMNQKAKGTVAPELGDTKEFRPKYRSKVLPCLGLTALLLLSFLMIGGFYILLTQLAVTDTPAPTHTVDLFPAAPTEAPTIDIPMVLPTLETPEITPLAATPIFTQPPARPTYTPWPTSTP